MEGHSDTLSQINNPNLYSRDHKEASRADIGTTTSNIEFIRKMPKLGCQRSCLDIFARLGAHNSQHIITPSTIKNT